MAWSDEAKKQAIYVFETLLVDDGPIREQMQSRLLAALDAAAAVDGDAGWQPIETAPKDGTRILVFGPSNDGDKTYIDVCAWPCNWDGLWPVAYMAYAAGEPSHWMPLPSPPSALKRLK